MLKASINPTTCPYPIAAQITDTGISVATFSRVPDEQAGQEMDAAALSALICGDPAPPAISVPFAWVNGNVLSPIRADNLKYRVHNHVRLGVDELRAVIADHSSIALLSDYTGLLYPVFNRTAARASGLRRPFYSSSDPDKRTVAVGSSGFLSKGWAAAEVVLHGNREQGVLVLDESGVAVDLPDWDESFNAPIPTLHFAGAYQPLAPDGMVDVQIECRDLGGQRCLDADVTIHVEAIAGFVPKTEVRMVAGLASVRVMALALDPGDSVIIKAGWGVTPGLATLSIPVA